MRKYLIASIMTVLLIVAAGCRTTTNVDGKYSYQQLDTSLINNNGDGTLTLRSWGQGSTMGEAVEQAKRNALETVLFKGLTGGNGFRQQALVTEVNARERYADYFEPFFSNGGEYMNFVTERSSSDATRKKATGTAGKTYSVVVVVNRSALRQQLINDGVITSASK